MPRNPVFVLCSGKCGSTYLADLLSQWTHARHEPDPDLWCEYVARARHCTPRNRVLHRIQHTRPLCNVEVNNRLSLLARDLVEAFEDQAVYVHLHRHPTDSVASLLASRGEVEWTRIFGGRSEFHAACRWWDRTNRSIRRGLVQAAKLGAEVYTLPFHELVSGQASGTLTCILGEQIDTYRTEPVNVSDREPPARPSGQTKDLLVRETAKTAALLGYNPKETPEP